MKLAFVLTPEAVSRFYDALICLAKFDEIVGLEASDEKLVLSSINSSKTAFAAFSLLNPDFFHSYHYRSELSERGRGSRVFNCKILAKCLLPIFKGRASDVGDGETSVERCEIKVEEDEETAEYRFVIRMVCRHGVRKTYKLNYDPSQVTRALFDSKVARNYWTISAFVLKAFSEFFGARTENLSMYFDTGRLTFDCFTEKIVNGKEVLKQPLHTSVAIDIADFNDYNLEEQLKIGISVKDFKAVIIHATTLKAPIMARYSIPRRPMQLSYSDGGLQCEFVFMTSGNSLDASATPRTSVSRTSASEARMRQSPQTLPLHQRRQPNRSPMPPPAWPTSRGAALETASQRTTRPSPPAPRASVNEESLFVGGDDEDDQVWGERTYEEDEGELRWASAGINLDNVTSFQSDKVATGGKRKLDDDSGEGDDYRIAPTQRLSQIKGLFD